MVFGRFADRGCDGLCVCVNCASVSVRAIFQCVAHLGGQICSLPRHLCFGVRRAASSASTPATRRGDFRALPTGYRRTTVGDPAWPWPQRRGRRAVRPRESHPGFPRAGGRACGRTARRANAHRRWSGSCPCSARAAVSTARMEPSLPPRRVRGGSVPPSGARGHPGVPPPAPSANAGRRTAGQRARRSRRRSGPSPGPRRSVIHPATGFALRRFAD